MLSIAGYLLKPGLQGQGELLCARQQAAFAVSLSLAILCLGAVLCDAPATASHHSGVPFGPEVQVCGDIVESTWTAAESPYYVTCDSTLLPGATLTIEPGVLIQFASGIGLTVEGMMSAIGTPGQPITFTSDLAEPAPGDWSGLNFVTGSSDSHLAWCVIEYATTAARIYAGPGETVSQGFSHCTVRHNSLHGMLIEGEALSCNAGLAQPTITGCTIADNGGYGIFGYGYSDPYNVCSEPIGGAVGGAVSHSVIQGNQGAGIFLHTEEGDQGDGDVWIAIESNIILGNSGPGLHLDGDYPVHPYVANNLIYDNTGAGLMSEAEHEEMELIVVNNTIAGNGEDGVVFNRSAAQVRLTNNIVIDNGRYGLLCLGAEGPQAANNDLWDNAANNYDGCDVGLADISADPRFTDAATGDFHLRFGSPCIDAGTSDGAPAADFDGITRPQGEEVDIGAHEFAYEATFLPLILCE